jgi:glycosyltransferase involved in cell wall biosynthesis
MSTISPSHMREVKVSAKLPGQESMSNLAAVLYLPNTPESLSYHPYLESVGSVTLLELLLSKFAPAKQSASLSVLFHAENATPKLQEILSMHNVNLISTLHKSQAQAFQQAVKQTRKPHTAFFTIEIGLSPEDLLTRAFLHHLACKNKFTFVKGLPIRCAPEIYDSDFLAVVCDKCVPYLPETPRAFIEHSIVGLKDKAASPSQNRVSRYLMTALSGLINTSLTSTPFDAMEAYGGDPSDLPESVKIEIPLQLEILSNVIDLQSQLSSAPTVSPLYGLYLWKKCLLKKQIEIRESLIDEIVSSTNEFGVKKRRRVLFVSNPSAYSGAEGSLCQLVGRLESEMYESFALIGCSGFYTDQLRKCGATVITRERDFSASTVDNMLFTLSVLKKVQPDVVHMNGTSGMPIILAAKLLDIPIVGHMRAPRYWRNDYDEYLRNSDVVIAVSEFVRNEVSKMDVEKGKIRVIHNGIDLQHFSRCGFDRMAMRKEFKLPQNARIALNIARFAPNKRHDLLIAASEIVRKSVPDFHLVLVGNIDDLLYYQSIIDQISKSGLKECVTFVGFQRDIRKIEAASDVLVSCSDREPLARCLIEAMAMEVPVIATDSGGSHELLRHEVTGLVTRGGDVDGLAKSMISVLTDKELVTTLSRSAREYAENELGIDLHVKRVTRIYEEVIMKAKTDKQVQ